MLCLQDPDSFHRTLDICENLIWRDFRVSTERGQVPCGATQWIHRDSAWRPEYFKITILGTAYTVAVVLLPLERVSSERSSRRCSGRRFTTFPTPSNVT